MKMRPNSQQHQEMLKQVKVLFIRQLSSLLIMLDDGHSRQIKNLGRVNPKLSSQKNFVFILNNYFSHLLPNFGVKYHCSPDSKIPIKKFSWKTRKWWVTTAWNFGVGENSKLRSVVPKNNLNLRSCVPISVIEMIEVGNLSGDILKIISKFQTTLNSWNTSDQSAATKNVKTGESTFYTPVVFIADNICHSRQSMVNQKISSRKKIRFYSEEACNVGPVRATHINSV